MGARRRVPWALAIAGAAWSAGRRRSFPFPISDPAPTHPATPGALRRAASNPRPPRTVPTPAAQPHRGSLHQSAGWLVGTATP
ncbi:hypothetical protein GQ55_7G160400 [Panicum hallii var. hallii]|uniref:Uncharacterized protein n=1 Tax=Panicum hallii var. hallii TaxID=1504633 RepID=A0A2T7CVM3_9POAL|nr:hypothetical protein GQ55_7G160400 [Panicum hallii var. hallii]